MKIAFISADWSNAEMQYDEDYKNMKPGGSNWYRCSLPAHHLAENGHETVVAEAVAPTTDGLVVCDRFGTEHEDIDLVVMQRIMDDVGFGLAKCARDAGQKIVNDVDDWYWGLHRSNAAHAYVNSKVNELSNLKHYRACIEASDLVTCSTPFLTDQISSWGCEVALVRNAIDLDRWTPHEQPDVPVVGWVGSTSHRSEDLETLRGTLGPFLDRHDLTFQHSGHNPGYPFAHELAGVNPERSMASLISSVADYPHQFEHLDIGLVPLNNIPFNEAKSFIKGLEYAASGIPFVAAALPEYKFLADAGIGRVAKKPYQWTNHLEALLDQQVRIEEAERHAKLLPQFDIANRWVDWLEVYESLVD